MSAMERAERSTKVRRSGPSRARLASLALLAMLVLTGCDGDDPCRALADGAAPHQEIFSRFARVAERLSGSDSAFADRAHLEESLFVSLRDEPTVLAAWVERSGPAPLSLVHPARAPAIELPFSTCRLPSGRLEAARGTLSMPGSAPGPAYFLRQSVTEAAQRLVITVAFVDDAPR